MQARLGRLRRRAHARAWLLAWLARCAQKSYRILCVQITGLWRRRGRAGQPASRLVQVPDQGAIHARRHRQNRWRKHLSCVQNSDQNRGRDWTQDRCHVRERDVREPDSGALRKARPAPPNPPKDEYGGFAETPLCLARQPMPSAL